MLPLSLVCFLQFKVQYRDSSSLPHRFFLWSFATRHKIAASEVSSILESRISGASVGGNVEETGRVLSKCMCDSSSHH